MTKKPCRQCANPPPNIVIEYCADPKCSYHVKGLFKHKRKTK